MKLITNKGSDTVFDLFIGIEEDEEKKWSSEFPAIWEKEKKEYKSNYFSCFYAETELEFFSEKKYLVMKLQGGVEYKIFSHNYNNEDNYYNDLNCNLYTYDDFYNNLNKKPIKEFKIAYVYYLDYYEVDYMATSITLEKDEIVVLELNQEIVNDADLLKLNISFFGEQPIFFRYNTRYFRNYQKKIDGSKWGINGKIFNAKSFNQIERANNKFDYFLRFSKGLLVDYMILSNEENYSFSSFENAKERWGDYINSPMFFEGLNVRKSNWDFTNSQPSIIKIWGNIYCEEETSFEWKIQIDDNIAIRINNDISTDKYYSGVGRKYYPCSFQKGLNTVELYLYDGGGDYYCYDEDNRQLDYYCSMNEIMTYNKIITSDYYKSHIKPFKKEYNISQNNIVLKSSSNGTFEFFTLMFDINIISEEDFIISSSSSSSDEEIETEENEIPASETLLDFFENEISFFTITVYRKNGINHLNFINRENQIKFATSKNKFSIQITYHNKLFVYIDGKNIGYIDVNFQKRPNLDFKTNSDFLKIDNDIAVYDGVPMSDNAIYYVYSRKL